MRPELDMSIDSRSTAFALKERAEEMRNLYLCRIYVFLEGNALDPTQTIKDVCYIQRDEILRQKRWFSNRRFSDFPVSQSPGP